MNSSTLLPSFNSTHDFTSKSSDILYVFILPGLGLYGITLKVLSIIVLSVLMHKELKKKDRGTMIFYLLTFETSDLMIAMTIPFFALNHCGSYCELGYSYLAKLIELILNNYIGNTNVTIQTFLEISFAIERLEAFSTIKRDKLSFRNKLLIIIIVSLLVSAPNHLISLSITPFGVLTINNNEILYSLTTSVFAENNIWKISLFVLVMLKGLVLYILILILNIIITFKFRAFLKKKSTLRGNNNNIINEQTTNFTNVDENTLNSKNESKKRKNQTAITKVYLAMSINFLIGYLPNSITPIIFIIGGSDSLIYNYFNILANIIGYLSHSLYIFLFYYFNNDYRETFKKVFCCL